MSFQAGGACDRVIPCWGKVAVACGKCGLGNMARGRRWGGVATFREMSSRVPFGFLFSCIMKVYELDPKRKLVRVGLEILYRDL